jgi:hypothetical protein
MGQNRTVVPNFDEWERWAHWNAIDAKKRRDRNVPMSSNMMRIDLVSRTIDVDLFSEIAPSV